MQRIMLVMAAMALLLGVAASAQNGKTVTDSWLSENYTRREKMIEVRDGKHIYTAIYEPRQEYLERLGRKDSPIMIMRTPYSLKPYGITPGQTESPATAGSYAGNLKGDMANYVADGWIIVLQNVRGKYLSEGDYENMRPYLSGKKGAAVTMPVTSPDERAGMPQQAKPEGM